MTKISFFTPIMYESFPKTCCRRVFENAEAYFNLGGKQAKAVFFNTARHSTDVVIVQQQVAVFKIIALIASYFTVIIPAIFLVLKYILRSQHKFNVISANSPLLKREMPVPMPVPQLPEIRHETTSTSTSQNQKNTVPNPILQVVPNPNTSTPTYPPQIIAPPVANTVSTSSLHISDKIKFSIERVIKQIFARERNSTDFSFLDDTRNTELVFSLPAWPNIVFTMGNPYWSKMALSSDEIIKSDWKSISRANTSTRKLYDNSLRAREAIKILAFDNLILPEAEMFEVEYLGIYFNVIAHERLKFKSDRLAQEKLYNSSSMLAPVIQLATLIATLGIDLLEFRYFPVLDEDPSYKGSPRIGLFNFGSIDSSPEGKSVGLFGMPKYPGGSGRTGLINMVYHDDQVEAIAQIATLFKIEDHFDAKNTRLEKLAFMRANAKANPIVP